MSDESSDSETPTDSTEESPRWPAVVGVLLIAGFGWAGVEIFLLQGAPVETLEHSALISDQGAYFEVEQPGKEYVVRMWTYRPEDGDDERLKKAAGKTSFAVLTPEDEVLERHEDSGETRRVRYLSFEPKTAGSHRVRVQSVESEQGESSPRVRATIYTGNNQILLPLLSKLVGRER